MSRSFFLSAFALSATLSASADPLLEMMRNVSKDGPVYAYEMTYSGEGVVATGKIDPSQPEGQRIDLYTPEMSELSEEFQEGIQEMDAESDGDIWCTDFAEMVPSNAEVSTQDDVSVTYAKTPDAAAEADKTEQKMMKKMNGTVTLDKSDGAVLAFSMTLPKPY